MFSDKSMLSSKKILFVTHESSLSGAPRSLLYFLEWLKKTSPKVEIHVLSLKSENQKNNAFSQLSDFYFDFTHLSTKPDYSLKNRIIHKLKGTPFQSERDIKMQQLVRNHYELIYANTVVSLPIALELKKSYSNSKVLLHVHEMATAIHQLLPKFDSLSRKVDYFIAASALVKEHLVRYFDCDETMIQRVYECSDISITDNLPTLEPILAKRVIMVGGAYWAKGDDIFLLVAKEVVSRDPSIHFYWLGSQSLERKTVNQGDIDKLEIGSHVHFLPHTHTPHDIVKVMDVFALTSRSDSFPLAAIEAGLLGVPIVCFEKASGIQEIIQQGGGEVVPYLDIQKMADTIISLVTSDALRMKKSREVKKLFESCKPDVISNEIAVILTKLLK
jgi:glycosyltransferase involved in cell wall biosynthesis